MREAVHTDQVGPDAVLCMFQVWKLVFLLLAAQLVGFLS